VVNRSAPVCRIWRVCAVPRAVAPHRFSREYADLPPCIRAIGRVVPTEAELAVSAPVEEYMNGWWSHR